MQEDWRYTAKSITKYNSAFRDQNGYYQKTEWIGFSQVGEVFDGEQFTTESYLETEKKYIQAAVYFFEFHKCDKIILRNIEKYDITEYKYDDKRELTMVYDVLTNEHIVSIENLGTIIKLILREILWAELFCNDSHEVAVRFGYDFYMYFNSNINIQELFVKVENLGLFVY